MNIASIAQELISNHLEGDTDGSAITQGMDLLFGNEDGGGFDINNIISSVSSNEALGSVLGSWLGDGENMSIDADTIGNIFNNDKISQFGSLLGIDAQNAQSLLANVIPQIVDKSSSGGSLLDGVDLSDGLDIQDAMAFAKNLF
jgi:uncharacterized protein YidB (DUF937 family)